ncbi:hypothetical protein Phou_043540 [Phytohabitans houttuyneae]|uniref:2-amino-4-hydroxy-6-hydroxymethyldihydropteridine diphosphokinase n=1 Tax=Phytohabitans houttuyneae TaxID=1076126 RepID=A0A6V8K8T1_9ACTN|nr:hypothetical protein Phou_043540 [Phytohabitans houttuyneae]
MTRAVLSLGSNLGDRVAHLRAAVRELEDVLLVASGVYETPPWGDDDQPPYLNAALLVQDPAATPATGCTAPGASRRRRAGCATRTGGSDPARSTST